MRQLRALQKKRQFFEKFFSKDDLGHKNNFFNDINRANGL
jgi:hypothetical protein